MLTPIHSRQRQKRLLDLMQAQQLDAVVVCAAHHVYYFAAHLNFVFHESAFLLFADGRSVFISANEPNKHAAADEVIAYSANVLGTLRQDQPARLAELILLELAGRRPSRIGIDASPACAMVAMKLGDKTVGMDEWISQMRRAKDADELELMMRAIGCCQAMYARAKEIIEPGVPELFVYAELHKEAVKSAGEPLHPAYLGNDYASGVVGGKARGESAAQDGELYILDLGPAYRGYFSDNARTFCVNRKPTDLQLAAWNRVAGCFRIIEQTVKPGAKCREVFTAVDEYLKQQGGKGMTHHLGHGVGLQAHEMPHLNPEWDETFIEGEVFTAEPGEYAEELRAGIRIEQDYLVTRDGVRLLIDSPLGLNGE